MDEIQASCIEWCDKLKKYVNKNTGVVLTREEVIWYHNWLHDKYAWRLKKVQDVKILMD